MLLDLIRGGNALSIFMGVCVSAFVVFCVMPIHEYSHALVATKLGDQTARLSGRLTLNPMAHISPWGAIMILLVGFGYAKPVPVNVRNTKMKNKKVAMALIALAGPLSNLIIGFLSVMVRYIIIVAASKRGGEMTTTIFALNIFFQYSAIININLAVFNLIPIPPLDGSRILFAILPSKFYFGIMKYERYIMAAMFLLLLTGVLTTPLSYLSKLIYNAFNQLFYSIF
ncbi:MAG TPA: site-2 protease family protein [Oscillospiraceae bacterium]|nr:site-2 protease family protein [Oscillospiraceae bacterium]